MNADLRASVLRALEKDVRYDGRKSDEFREITVETGMISTAEGSARVRFGETEMIVGIKTEVGRPYPDSPNRGNIMIGAEFSPMASPDFEPGPPSIESIELSRVVDRGIRESGSIDFKKLCIKEGELVWTIIVDICIVNDAGNLLDAAALGTIAALKDAKLPELDGETINYKKLTKTPVPVTKTPIEVTVYKIKDKFIIDPIPEEQEVADARLTAAILENGDVCALQKGLNGPVTIEDVATMLDICIKKSEELRKHIA